MSQDLHPTGINVYGYSVAWVPAGATAWQMEPDDEYRNLPAHYPRWPRRATAWNT